MENLIGLNKKEIIEKLGDSLNVPFSKEWTYLMEKKFFYNKILTISFDENNKVLAIEIKKKFKFL